jgi:hypothetical protein
MRSRGIKMVVRAILRAGIELFVALYLVVGGAIGSAGPPLKVAGTFSSLAYNAEGGDLIGYEVRIVPTNEGLKALVQVAQGDSGKVYLVGVDQKGDVLSFDVPLSSNIHGRFEGTVSPNGLDGKISYPTGAIERVSLKRTTSYWER